VRKHVIIIVSVLTFVGVYHKCTAQESPDLIEQDLRRVADSLSSLAVELTPFMDVTFGVDSEFRNQFGAFQIHNLALSAHDKVWNTRLFALISPDRRATEIAICEGLAYNIGFLKMAEWSVRKEMKRVTDTTIIRIGTRTRIILASLVERLGTFDWGPCGSSIERRLQFAESVIEETETEMDSAGFSPVNPQ